MSPCDCNVFWLQSADATAFLEDTTGVGGPNVLTLSASVLQYLPPSNDAALRGGPRFSAQDTITYLSATVEGQKVILTFIR
jgi:hypothetical protein